MRYSFANCVLDLERHLLERGGEAVRTEPQVFDLLHLLVQNAGLLVSRDRIIDEIWGGRIVSESTISARINAARKAVGDSGRNQAVIKTITRRGLQLVVPVRQEGGGTVLTIPSGDSPEDRQIIRFTQSRDGTQIAYATSGHGSPLMRAGHFLTHLELDWNSVIWRPYLDALGAKHQLVRFDQRGTGLSDATLNNPSLENYVADLKAVADAAELERFPMVASSQGVPIAVRFAAENPDRVSCLILYGGYTKGRQIRNGKHSTSKAEAMQTLVQEGWGKPQSAFMVAFTALFCPDATHEQLRSLVDMQLNSTSPDNALRIRTAIDRFTVADVLDKVQAPTLVIHARDDSVHPLSEGQRLASGIPGAEFVMLESANHLCLPTDPVWPVYVGAIEEFLERHNL